jgi:hypothetical protein
VRGTRGAAGDMPSVIAVTMLTRRIWWWVWVDIGCHSPRWRGAEYTCCPSCAAPARPASPACRTAGGGTPKHCRRRVGSRVAAPTCSTVSGAWARPRMYAHITEIPWAMVTCWARPGGWGVSEEVGRGGGRGAGSMLAGRCAHEYRCPPPQQTGLAPHRHVEQEEAHDVVPHAAALLHGRHDGCEVVIGQDHLGGLL